MKKDTLFVICICLASLSAYGQSAKVYFIRSNEARTSGAFNTHLLVDKQKVCSIKNMQVGVVEVSAGEHSFSTSLGKSEESPAVRITVESGKAYYLAYVPLLQVFEVTENTGKQLLGKVSEIDCKKEK